MGKHLEEEEREGRGRSVKCKFTFQKGNKATVLATHSG